MPTREVPHADLSLGLGSGSRVLTFVNPCTVRGIRPRRGDESGDLVQSSEVASEYTDRSFRLQPNKFGRRCHI